MEHGHNYLTPEIVATSAKSGCDLLTIWRQVLQAVETKRVEDAAATAFVALTLEKERKKTS